MQQHGREPTFEALETNISPASVLLSKPLDQLSGMVIAQNLETPVGAMVTVEGLTILTCK
jgi:hypothetical protein